MWKKDENEQGASVRPRPVQPAAGGQTQAPRTTNGPATIGPSITIKGDVTGDEDLVIEGRVEGTIDLKKHNVTVGPEGRVKADIFGRIVVIEGEVEGDLRGQEQIVLRRSARVQGNITAPRVALEDGATFRGGIDMESSSVRDVGADRNLVTKGADRSPVTKEKDEISARKDSSLKPSGPVAEVAKG